jgi:23S rRNA (guanosine2251-2'-O)-methyltransferase
VLEAVRSGRARRVIASRSAHATPGMRELLEEADRAGVQVETSDPAALPALGIGDHQGVAAVVAPIEELHDRGFASASFGPDAIAVVLDGVTDPQNLGACARAAEAAGVAVLVVRTRRAAPLSPAAVNASAGALFHLTVARVTNLSRAIGHLKDKGFLVVGLDHRAPTTIQEEERPSGPLALVVGAEDVGLSRLVRESCDLLLAIPMRGRTRSLNAAAALAVGLFGFALRGR